VQTYKAKIGGGVTATAVVSYNLIESDNLTVHQTRLLLPAVVGSGDAYLYDLIDFEDITLYDYEGVQLSQWFVGDYDYNGVKEVCIFYKNKTATTNLLKCFDSVSVGLDIDSPSHTFTYPYNMDVNSNSWIMGSFNATDKTEMCFSGFQGIACAEDKGGWLYVIDENTRGFGYLNETKLHTAWDDYGSAGIVTNNNKPYVVVPNFQYNESDKLYGKHGYTVLYEDINGKVGDNKYYYDNQILGINYYNAFSYFGQNQSVKNVILVSESGTNVNAPIYSSLGVTLDGVNQYINISKNLTSESGTIYLKFLTENANAGNIYVSKGTESASNGSFILQINNSKVLLYLPDNTAVLSSVNNVNLTSDNILYYVWNTTNHSIYLNGNSSNSTISQNKRDNTSMISYLGYGYQGGYFDGTIDTFIYYTYAQSITDITQGNVVGDDGTCLYNSDCPALYPYCILGCCVNNYNDSFPSGFNQCHADDDECTSPFNWCAKPLNESFTGYTCVQDYQNNSCYFQQDLYDFYENQQTEQTESCPAEFLGYIAGSDTPSATCRVLGQSACVQDIIEDLKTTFYSQYISDLSFDMLGQGSNNGLFLDYSASYILGLIRETLSLDGENTGMYNGSYQTSYYSCAGGHVLYVDSNESQCTVCGFYCDMNDEQTGFPTFNQCENEEQCLNGQCTDIQCIPNYEVCSDGTDFTNTLKTGDVYKCNADGTAYILENLCGENQNCTEYTAYNSECVNKLVYYCASQNQVQCNLYYSTSGQVPANCFETEQECTNSIGIGNNNNNQLGDGSNTASMGVVNLLLGGSTFLKMFFAIMIICGCIFLPLYYMPNAHWILGLISGFVAMVGCTVFGLIPFYFIVIVIIGTIGMFFLSKMLGGNQNQ
jgi:hypothetical protein